jgi:hypothetical protein
MRSPLRLSLIAFFLNTGILSQGRLRDETSAWPKRGGRHIHSANPRSGAEKISFFIAKVIQGDLVFLKSLLQAGKIVPVIDRRYPLSDAAKLSVILRKDMRRGKSC